MREAGKTGRQPLRTTYAANSAHVLRRNAVVLAGVPVVAAWVRMRSATRSAPEACCGHSHKVLDLGEGVGRELGEDNATLVDLSARGVRTVRHLVVSEVMGSKAATRQRGNAATGAA